MSQEEQTLLLRVARVLELGLGARPLLKGLTALLLAVVERGDFERVEGARARPLRRLDRLELCLLAALDVHVGSHRLLRLRCQALFRIVDFASIAVVVVTLRSLQLDRSVGEPLT